MAAGIDYTIVTGTNPGGLGRTILAEIRSRRLAEASRTAASSASAYTPEGVVLGSVLEERDRKQERAELDGGIVLLGRGALKEYLWALRKGFNEEIDLVEEGKLEGLGLGAGERRKDGRWEREEEVMVRELAAEDLAADSAPFDYVEPVASFENGGRSDPADDDILAPAALSMAYAPYRNMMPTTPLVTDSPVPAPARSTLPPPAQLPPQPPLLFVPFSHPFGVIQWPSKLLHFFNHRDDVRRGGEFALMAINDKYRPMENPTLRTESGELQGLLDDELVAQVRRGEQKDLTMEDGVPSGSKDLDMSFEKEETPSYFRKSYRTLPSAHEYAKRTFYTVDLPPKLAIARELAGGRTPTKAENKYPPKTENELRKDRLEKELRWRRELEGWGTRRAGSGLAWDEKWGMSDAFKVFVPLTGQDREDLKEGKRRWEEEEQVRKLNYDSLSSSADE